MALRVMVSDETKKILLSLRNQRGVIKQIPLYDISIMTSMCHTSPVECVYLDVFSNDFWVKIEKVTVDTFIERSGNSRFVFTMNDSNKIYYFNNKEKLIKYLREEL